VSIKRYKSSGHLSAAVEHNGVVYVAGMTAADRSAPVKGQTAEILKKIDATLALAGTDKSKLLSATIWLSDIRTREQMNEAWMEWVDRNNLPARASIESRLGTADCLVEIMVTCAK
jgi:enamine deaminase RidA (YjgF/YER057c/UK114 family)